jgi:hypothetical protein
LSATRRRTKAAPPIAKATPLKSAHPIDLALEDIRKALARRLVREVSRRAEVAQNLVSAQAETAALELKLEATKRERLLTKRLRRFAITTAAAAIVYAICFGVEFAFSLSLMHDQRAAVTLNCTRLHWLELRVSKFESDRLSTDLANPLFPSTPAQAHVFREFTKDLQRVAHEDCP